MMSHLTTLARLFRRLGGTAWAGVHPSAGTGRQARRWPGRRGRFFRFGLALVGLGLAGPLQAELLWQQRRLLLEPPAGAMEVAGVFECVNPGQVPIRVIDVHSGCGCTVTGLDADVIPPGGKGILHAVFQVGERRGPQTVTITVTTAEPAIVRQDLTLEVIVKDFATVSPRALVWRLGEDTAPKTLQVQVAAGFRFVGATSVGPEFRVEVAGEEGNSVRLRVTPRDTWARRSAAIRVEVARPESPAVVLQAGVHVQ